MPTVSPRHIAVALSRSARTPLKLLLAGVLLATSLQGEHAAAVFSPTLQTDRGGYAAGDDVTINGQGFAPGETVTFLATHDDGTAEPAMGHDAWATAADENGTVSAAWAINAGDSVGRRFVVRASGALSGATQSAVFLRAPQVSTDRAAYVATEPVSIEGRDFVANETVTLQVTHTDGTAESGMVHEPFVATVGADGTLWASWTPSLEDLSGPSFTVTATGDISGLVAPAAFRREGIVEPDKGDYQPGETALFVGRGFAPGEVVQVQVTHVTGLNDGNGHQPFFVSADTAGAFTTTWFVDPDDSLHNKFLVAASGQTSGVNATATFWDAGTVSLTTFGTAYTQDFDTLASTGTSSTVPTGWDFAETGTGANTLYTTGTGSGTAGDTYSFGAAASAERAFGGLQSGSVAPTIGAQFTNTTGGTITSLAVGFTGEQWRRGQNSTSNVNPDRIDFQYSVNATSLTTGTWTDADALDFSSPFVTTVGLRDGNAAGNRTTLSSTISGLTVPAGSTFWIRWNSSDLAPGADDGLAIDDFSLTPAGEMVTETAPSVSAVVPAGGAADVAVSATISITFSEPVNLTGAWFSLTCASSGAHTAAVTGGPLAYTLDPDTDFSNSESCTLTVDAASVSDQDAVDPPDTLAADFVTSFATEANACLLPFTPAYTIQGSGLATALAGSVTTQGVVVGDYEYSGSGSTADVLRGFFIQDQSGDADEATSDGLFVFNGGSSAVSLGQVVRVTGTVSEFQGQTQISAATIRACGTGSVDPVDVTLPVPDATYLERYEGMLVRFPQVLTVTEHFQLGRFGQVLLSSGGRLKQPTNVTTPGAAALALQTQNDLNQILLDDARQAQNPDPIVFARGGLPLSASNTLRGGDTATGIVGVLNYTWGGNAASPNAYRVRPVNALGGSVNFEDGNARPTAVPSVGGTVKVVGMNLLNFFNTYNNPTNGCLNGVSGVPTDCRGADSAVEFARQYPKTVEAILALDADVLGVNELENDGYGPTSALQFLVDQLNAASGPGTYAFIDVDANTGQIDAMGDDAIRVAMLYKPAVVTPIGTTAALNTAAFVNGGDSGPRNRASLAQAFRSNANNAAFIVNVNHLKSKGSACDLADQADGQGNCNQVRVNAVNELLSWLATDPTATGDSDVLMVGDYNWYAKEDPITTLEGAGFTNLVEAFQGADAYSYVFDGQWGYLDQALGSASVLSQVTGVADYHINADEPSVLDYNSNFKTAGQLVSLYAPDRFRVSDHDPVVIGLKPNDAPTASGNGPYAASEGGSVTLTATGVDPNGDALTYVWDLDNNGSFETAGQSVSFSAALLDGPSGPCTVTVRATDPDGLSGDATTTVSVNNAAPTVNTLVLSSEPSVEGQAVTASATFVDPGPSDGPFTCTVDYGDGSGPLAGTVVGSTCTGPVHAYTTFGAYTVAVRVTDKDGGFGSRTVLHDVNFAFTGFLPPVKNLPVANRVKAGQEVELEFRLGGNKGLRILKSVTSTAVSCAIGAGADDVTDTVLPKARELEFENGKYEFEWKTQRAWSNQCRLLTLTLIDDTTHSVLFMFRK